MRRPEIVAALTALGVELHSQGVTGEMYLVGGAAIALAFDERRSTRDVDAVFEPKASVYAAAEAIAPSLGLPVGWLNDAVKGFLAGPDPGARPVLEVPGLRCAAASPRIRDAALTHHERRRRLAVDLGRDRGQPRALEAGPEHPEDHHVVDGVAVAVPAA